MKDFKNKVIIGIDHGYGNIKTANHIFKTGVMEYDAEPLFTNDMLVYNGKYYTIGEGHKEFKAEKQSDDDYYVLTLAAIAMELDDNDLTEADVFIAAGLPLTWTSGQKAEFAEYLTKNERVTFVFRKVRYRIRIVGAKIYPQGYAAVANFASSMKGVNMVADIGNGTMNTLTIINGAPQQGRMFTEKFGTHQCTLAVREQFMRQTRREIDDAIIEEVLINGKANLSDADLKIIKATATEYVNNIFRRLREHGYDDKSTTLYVTGGGGCLVKNFYDYDKSRVFFVDDICAAAKGYEHMAELQLGTGAGI
jgi:plasmid segregation protein ParM